MSRKSSRLRYPSLKAQVNFRQGELLKKIKEERKLKQERARIEREQRRKAQLEEAATANYITDEELRKRTADFKIHANVPLRKQALSQTIAIPVVGASDSSKSRSKTLVPDPPTQLSYAIRLANEVLSNPVLQSSQDNLYVQRLIKVSNRLLEYTTLAPGQQSGKEWSGKGAVPTNWKCWLCGEGPILVHEAEHVIPQFEMSGWGGIFSRTTGHSFAGLSLKQATDFIKSITDQSMLNIQKNKFIFSQILKVTLLITEMFPSDQCCNQLKLNKIFYIDDLTTNMKIPYTENITELLENIWDYTFQSYNFHDCSNRNYKSKLAKYKSNKKQFVADRLIAITEIVQDVCDITNDKLLFKDLNPSIARIAEFGHSTLSSKTELPADISGLAYDKDGNLIIDDKEKIAGSTDDMDASLQSKEDAAFSLLQLSNSTSGGSNKHKKRKNTKIHYKSKAKKTTSKNNGKGQKNNGKGQNKNQKKANNTRKNMKKDNSNHNKITTKKTTKHKVNYSKTRKINKKM